MFFFGLFVFAGGAKPPQGDGKAKVQSQASVVQGNGGSPGHTGKRQWSGKHFRENVTLG